MKGQMTAGNMAELFFATLFYCIVVYPILVPLINDTVLTLQAHPANYTSATVFLLQCVPIGLGLSLLILIWFFAIPHPQQQRY